MNWPIKANWPAQRRTRIGPITEDQRNPQYNNQFELGGFSSSQISLLFCQPPFLISEAVVVPFLKIEGRSSREQRMNGRKVEVQQLPNLITRYIACRSPERFMAVFLGQQKEGHKNIYFAVSEGWGQRWSSFLVRQLLKGFDTTTKNYSQPQRNRFLPSRPFFISP